MLGDFKSDEEGRLQALERLGLLDTLEEEPFEQIISLVQQSFDVPMCAVSLVAEDRQWFKARRGLAVPETDRSVSFCAHTIQDTGEFVVNDAAADPRFRENPLVTGDPHIRSYCGIPLNMPDGYTVGTLCVIDERPRSYSRHEIAVLRSFASLVVEKIELRQIAARDELTNAHSRRAWIEKARSEVERAKRNGQPLSIVVLDIDHFKAVNDTHGHAAGDQVIKHVAHTVLSDKRKTDVFGRFGGEEFVLLMPETDIGRAEEIAERMRADIAAQDTRTPEALSVTVSAGVAGLSEGAGELEEILDKADAALYRAKGSGRNRVVTADWRAPIGGSPHGRCTI